MNISIFLRNLEPLELLQKLELLEPKDAFRSNKALIFNSVRPLNKNWKSEYGNMLQVAENISFLAKKNFSFYGFKNQLLF